MKRLFDIVCSIFLIVTLLPVFIFVSGAIIVREGSPILFKQNRLGYRGKPFRLLKFRSMIINADKKGGYSTVDNDPRITKIGHYIRRTSIDELPQLFNVLRGDMSLVGPRPDVAAQVENYSAEEWEERTSVKPGITGLAQATLRSDATPEQRLSLDLDYARDHGTRRDVAIIIMTLLTLFRRGAN